MKPCGLEKAPRDCPCCKTGYAVTNTRHGRNRRTAWVDTAKRGAKRSERNRVRAEIRALK